MRKENRTLNLTENESEIYDELDELAAEIVKLTQKLNEIILVVNNL